MAKIIRLNPFFIRSIVQSHIVDADVVDAGLNPFFIRSIVQSYRHYATLLGKES